MELAQRPGPRFFAAFYRWSRHTHRLSPCNLSSHRSRLPKCPATLAPARPYHATCRLNEEKQLTHGIAHEAKSSTAAAKGSDSALGEPGEKTGSPAHLREEFRNLMRKVPASVAVITVAHLDPKTHDSLPMGTAVSSLSSVTLDPPTISFNIKQPSQALDAIRHANGRFRVHWLNGNNRGLKVIENFCNGNHPEAYKQRHRELTISHQRSEPGSHTPFLAPRITGPAIRAAAECTMTHDFDIGDHVILVAQITDLRNSGPEDPTIAYVDGSYRSLGSTHGILGRHQDHQGSKQPAVQQQDTASSTHSYATEEAIKSTLDRAHELSIAYDWPAIPGDAERGEYLNRLASYIKNTQGDRKAMVKSIIACLQPETRQLASSLGIDLGPLIADCFGKNTMKRQALPRFYGRLSPAQLAELGNRMTQLVKADRKCLDVKYIALLDQLSVAAGASSLLPSDLLDPLRDAGLLPPFEPSASLLKQNGTNGNVLVMEQVEHAVQAELFKLSDNEKLSVSMSSLLRRANLSDTNGALLWQSLIRLKIETCRSFPEIWQHDIAGELTSEEVRVVMRRLVAYMGFENERLYSTRIGLDSNALLRGINVHPLVTGVNIDFVVDKLRYLHCTTKDFSFLRGRVEEMLQPYFDSVVTWEDLKSRTERFVQRFPVRATTWAQTDMLAAMALSERTLISTPLTETPNTIEKSNLLDMLMVNALKKHYGDGTEEEDKVIATFLKERYNLDVTGESFKVTLEEALARSSADDLEAALAQHRAETFPIGNTST